jgi:large subunit ribosomal protein L35
MPKMKTHKATAKRFKLSGKGKVMHLHGGDEGGRGHLRRRRSKSLKQEFDRLVPLENKKEQRRIKRLAPYLKKKK